MCAQEAAALLEHLSSFPERMARFNRNAVAVAGFLGEHPGIARIFFNGHPGHRSHATARRLLAGAGSVMSFTLANDSEDAMRAFYDSALPGIVKAPSLGSDMTLLCPYTLLTHYGEAEEVLAATGLPRYLLRLAVGCEQDIAPVLRAVREALANVKKVSGG